MSHSAPKKMAQCDITVTQGRHGMAYPAGSPSQNQADASISLTAIHTGIRSQKSCSQPLPGLA